MKSLLLLVLIVFLPSGLVAQTDGDSGAIPADGIILGDNAKNLDEFLWIKRPLVVFADSPADPQYVRQMEYITARLADLDERDVVVLTDTDPAARSDLRKELRPRGFMLVLIGKDGAIYLRKPLPWDVREITRVIDKLPVRQQEMRESLGDS